MLAVDWIAAVLSARLRGLYWMFDTRDQKLTTYYSGASSLIVDTSMDRLGVGNIVPTAEIFLSSFHHFFSSFSLL